jgi:hypothetical protein
MSGFVQVALSAPLSGSIVNCARRSVYVRVQDGVRAHDRVLHVWVRGLVERRRRVRGRWVRDGSVLPHIHSKAQQRTIRRARERVEVRAGRRRDRRRGVRAGGPVGPVRLQAAHQYRRHAPRGGTHQQDRHRAAVRGRLLVRERRGGLVAHGAVRVERAQAAHRVPVRVAQRNEAVHAVSGISYARPCAASRRRTQCPARQTGARGPRLQSHVWSQRVSATGRRRTRTRRLRRVEQPPRAQRRQPRREPRGVVRAAARARDERVALRERRARRRRGECEEDGGEREHRGRVLRRTGRRDERRPGAGRLAGVENACRVEDALYVGATKRRRARASYEEGSAVGGGGARPGRRGRHAGMYNTRLKRCFAARMDAVLESLCDPERECKEGMNL